MKDNLLYITSEKLEMSVVCNTMYLNLGKQSKEAVQALNILAFGKSIVKHVTLKENPRGRMKTSGKSQQILWLCFTWSHQVTTRCNQT